MGAERLIITVISNLLFQNSPISVKQDYESHEKCSHVKYSNAGTVMNVLKPADKMSINLHCHNVYPKRNSIDLHWSKINSWQHRLRTAFTLVSSIITDLLQGFAGTAREQMIQMDLHYNQ